MLKRMASVLLVLLVMLTGTALAEEKLLLSDEEMVTAQVTLTVLDVNEEAFVGANVTLRDATGTIIQEFVYEEPVVLELVEGSYTVRAEDTSDGYAAAKTIYVDADQELVLVIRKLQKGTKATVGTVTRLSGEFFTDMWGNNTSDIDVRSLIHGLSTISWTLDRQYGMDPTVLRDVTAEYDAQGNKTYIFTLNDTLRYSDGTPLTAADYVFSVLLQSAKEMAALGAKTLTYSQIIGYDAFASGDSDVFSGVRLISDTQFSLTISGRFLPYFYELMYVNVNPYPISVIAPDCEIRDDGNGAYIYGEFTTELLEKTVLDSETGYQTHPTVTSGAYMLTGYDEETGVATFMVNPYYVGNYQGIKPVIESLELSHTTYDVALDQLAEGGITVFHRATNGDVIDAGLARFAEGEFSATNYLRNGYGFLAFACEEGATSSVSVRQAMAMCLDRAAMIEDYLSSYGMEVYSYYGLGQWVAQPFASTMQDEVTVYEYDTDAAVALLEKDGWKLNANGDRFTAGVDDIRYKKEGGVLVPLELRFAQVQGNDAAQWIVDNYAPVLREIGFSFEVTEVTFEEMLSHYYRQTDRTYNLMYLATNFAALFDPYYNFNPDEVYQGSLNTSGISDKKLLELAKNLRETEPGDEETYTERWLELMKRYSDVLPTLPIYSNIYFDFFANDLMDYEPNAHWSWTSAILYAYFDL